MNSMHSLQQTPCHFGEEVVCPRLRNSSQGHFHPFYEKAEPVPSTYYGSGSEPPTSNETRSIASSQRNGHFSTFGATQSTAASRSEFVQTVPKHKDDLVWIQSQIKPFVKSMVRGRELTVLSADGQLRTCTCSFDRKLRNYNLVINKEIRTIPLSQIKEVFQGDEPEDIATPLDQLCATIMLFGGECLSFRFGNVRDRETFSLCLQIVIDGNP